MRFVAFTVMSELLFLEDARMWLTNEVHDRRRDSLLVTIGFVALTILSVLLGMWVIGVEITAGVLFVLGVLYLVYGKFRHEPPVISAETSRPRALGVIRNPMMTRNAYEQAWFDWSYAVGFLMAPIHLPVEAWKLMRRRARMHRLESEPVVRIVALLAEAKTALPVAEINQRLPDVNAADVLEQLDGLRGLVVLNEPLRITLTDSVVNEIRGG